MSKIKKIISIILILVCISTLMTGCDENNNQIASEPSPSVESTESESKVDSKDIKNESSEINKKNNTNTTKSSPEEISIENSTEEKLLSYITYDEIKTDEELEEKLSELDVIIYDENTELEDANYDDVIRYGKIKKNTVIYMSPAAYVPVSLYYNTVIYIVKITDDKCYFLSHNKVFYINSDSVELLPEDYDPHKNEEDVYEINLTADEWEKQINTKVTKNDVIRYGQITKNINFYLNKMPIQWEFFSEIVGIIRIDDDKYTIYYAGQELSIDSSLIKLLPENYTPNLDNKYYKDYFNQYFSADSQE